MIEDLSQINITLDIKIMFVRHHQYVYQQQWASAEYHR
jgi:hypothetical protein